MSYKALSLDCETLGTGHYPYLLSVGVVLFNVDVPGLGPSGEWFVAPDQPGAEIDPGTVRWWMTQAPEARAAAFGSVSRLDISIVLGYLDEIFKQHPVEELWIKGGDWVWLERHYEAHGRRRPWWYSAIRDVRTEMKSAQRYGFPLPNTVVQHSALQDAIDQAITIQEIYQWHRARK